ncbi:hypothetical protein P7C70_g3772, partial [Phenoliferia sp. Uapishka_3]
MLSILSFPDEMIIKIFRHAMPLRTLAGSTHDNATALSLALSCQLFRQLAQSLLYSNLVLFLDSDAKSVLKSPAFARYRTEELQFGAPSQASIGLAQSRRPLGRAAVPGGESMIKIIKICGSRGLLSLKLGLFVGHFDTKALLDMAGSSLKSLVIDGISLDNAPRKAWNIPFQLKHLHVGGMSIPPERLSSALITTSLTTMSSLSLASNTFPEPQWPLFGSPIFRRLAPQITSLTLSLDDDQAKVDKLLRTNLALMTAVSHLSLNFSVKGVIEDLVGSFPAHLSTITHLSLRLQSPAWNHQRGKSYYESPFQSSTEQDELRQILGANSLKKLDVLEFGHQYSIELENKIRALLVGRDVKLEWEEKEKEKEKEKEAGNEVGEKGVLSGEDYWEDED